MWLWLALGCLLLGAAAIVVAHMEGAALGPYATRLLAIGAALAGYYGVLGWLRFGRSRTAPLHWHFLHYAVPAAAAAGALYCLYQVARNWRGEVHGLAKTLFKLVVVLVLGALGWLCFTR
jgi:hypothetical protein